jgi:hypothetical protein
MELLTAYCPLIPFPALALRSENVIFGDPTRSRGNCG